MTPDIVYCKDVPENKSTHIHLCQVYDLLKYWERVPPRGDSSRLMKYVIPGIDQAALLQQAEQITAENGWWGFASMYKESEQRDPFHGGFSITYNPYRSNVPIYASSLGQTKNNVGDIFFTEFGPELVKVLEESRLTEAFARVCSEQGLRAGKELLNSRGITIGEDYDWDQSFSSRSAPTRNGYFDTYRFNKLVPAVQAGAFKELTDKFKVMICRSRCAWLRPGNELHKDHHEHLWHTDESVFVNLRVNIPLKTTPNFFLENKMLGKVHLEVGYGYSWNTEILHRVGCHDTALKDERVHLVIGTIPWFDYLPEEDAFTPNKFFGKKHPFDMLADGDIIEGVRCTA